MVEEISTGYSQHISKIATGFLASPPFYSGFGVSTYYPKILPFHTPPPPHTYTHTHVYRSSTRCYGPVSSLWLSK